MHLEAYFEAILCILGPSWGHLGHGGPLGAILKHLGAVLGLSRRRLGASLGLIGPSWGHLGAILEPSWGHLGPSWDHLGAILAEFKHLEGHKTS